MYSLIKGLIDGLKPEPDLTVSEWADANRVLPRIAAAEHGQWRTSRTPYLREIMDCLSASSDYKNVVVMKGGQLGFALDIDTPILTSYGFKNMEFIGVGDYVFGDDGQKARVEYVSPIMYGHQCYDVVFSDGSIIKCDSDHLWTLTDCKDYKNPKKVTIRTHEVAKTFKHRGYNRYALDNAKPVHLPKKELNISPYLFGYWLGNGNSYSNRITTHTDDAEEICTYISEEGNYCKLEKKHSKGNCTEIVITKPDNECQRGHNLLPDGLTKNGKCKQCHRDRSAGRIMQDILYKPFAGILKDYGVFGNKFTPDAYLYSSIDNRLALIQGLMDSAGHIRTDGYCEWYSVNNRLTDDMYKLLASLGFKPKKRVKKGGKCKIYDDREYDSKDINVLTFHPYKELPIFKLKRKVERLKKKNECRHTEIDRRRIVDVRARESVPVKCISVDNPSHLYLAGYSLIPTHNTEAGNNWIGYIIDNTPAPTLMVQPTEETVKRNSKMRIDTMINACPSLYNKVARQKSRNGENTITQKNFPGGILLMTGANSAVGLRSVPIRFLFLDEIDGYPYDLDGEGSPVDLAVARTSTFARKKIFIISTPTLKGNSAIEKEFQNTDQRYYEVPCPHCGSYQRLVFENLKWPEGDTSVVQYQCTECAELIPERFKTQMLENGGWKSYNPEKASKDLIGFHLSALYSPLGWLSWSDIASQYEKAKEDPAKMVTFTNMVLGESFEESGEAPGWETIYNKSRMESNKQNVVPANVCFITVGVDVQKDRLELEIVGWCADRQSYSIDYRVLLGNTTLPDVWEQLKDEVINGSWTREDGIELHPLKIAIDSGYNTTEVYSFCRKFTGNKVIPTKGQDNLGMPVSPPRQIDYNKNGKKIGKLKQWNIGVSMLKGELYQWLRLEPKEDGTYPPCYCHFPQYDKQYFEGLVAEQYIQKTHKWKKVYDRNEPLDTRIYARAAANIVGLDRMKPEQLMKMGAVSISKVSTPKPDNIEEGEPERKRKYRRSSFWGWD